MTHHRTERLPLVPQGETWMRGYLIGFVCGVCLTLAGFVLTGWLS